MVRTSEDAYKHYLHILAMIETVGMVRIRKPCRYEKPMNTYAGFSKEQRKQGHSRMMIRCFKAKGIMRFCLCKDK